MPGACLEAWTTTTRPTARSPSSAPEGDEPDEISAGDSVAGQPDQDGGEVQEGAQGPNAIPDDPTGEHPHKP